MTRLEIEIEKWWRFKQISGRPRRWQERYFGNILCLLRFHKIMRGYQRFWCLRKSCRYYKYYRLPLDLLEESEQCLPEEN